MGLEKQAISGEKTEYSVDSVPQSNLSLSVTTSKKAGSIKIKLSRALVLQLMSLLTIVDYYRVRDRNGKSHLLVMIP